MKKILIGCLMLCAAAASFAGTKTDYTQADRGHWNPVTVYNHTDKDIAYIMNGSFGGAVYGVLANGIDLYHSGFGDSNATFDIGVCNKVTGDRCTDPDPADTKPCTDGSYNAEEIHAIYITSLTTCTVVCNDGTTDSCKVT